MRGLIRNAMTLTAFAVGMTCAGIAQSTTTTTNSGHTDLRASVDPPATPATATPNGGTDATHPPAGEAKPELQPTVTQEIEALKGRIDELENEVKEEKARALADSTDTAAIKAAEKELVAGNGSAALSSATSLSPVVHAVVPGESSSLQA